MNQEPFLEEPEKNDDAAGVSQAPLPWYRTPKLGLAAKILLGVMLVPLVVGSAVFAHYYSKYGRMIDAKLAAGAFSNTFNIFAEPHSLITGDEISPEDLANELRRSGFVTANTNQPGTYSVSKDQAEIYPAAGSGARPCHIQFAARKITRIVLLPDGNVSREYTLPAPLIANVSENREKRHIVHFSEIPKVLVNAVVSVEDKRYFQHNGLDILRLIKAAYVDLREGRKEQGASTLSMQLSRGLWLDPDKNWKRKAAEIMIALHLERKLSKEQIFETYANQVFLGQRGTYSIHGFGEGARAYFDKDVQQLTLPQAALLAGIVQRPSYLNPYRYPDRATDRRGIVLALMRQNKYISQDEYEKSVDAPLDLAKEVRDANDEAPYFLDLVNEELQNRPEIHENANSVYTTLDLNLQRAAADAIRIGMKEVDDRLRKRTRKGKPMPDQNPQVQVALVAIDPHTGAIKALAGGRNYSASQLDHVLAKRPPGSVFKPFVYAAALNTAVDGSSQVFTPASTVVDEPTTFWFANKPYEPNNYHEAFYGTVTLRKAMAKSMNVATVKVGEAVGFDRVVAMAQKAGLNGKIAATPAVALGSYDVTPLEMAGAYTVFGNAGEYVKPSLVGTVKSRDGAVVYQHNPEPKRALDPRVAYLMVSMLEEVMRTGTAAGVRSKGFTVPAAGKTGTSHDGWFAGFTSDLLCVVWVGYDDYRELNLDGAHSALPVWVEFMKRALHYPEYHKAKEFPQPKGVSQTKICNDSGQLASSFCPSTRWEVFVDGTEPQETCALHKAEEFKPDTTVPILPTEAAAPPQ